MVKLRKKLLRSKYCFDKILLFWKSLDLGAFSRECISSTLWFARSRRESHNFHNDKRDVQLEGTISTFPLMEIILRKFGEETIAYFINGQHSPDSKYLVIELTSWDCLWGVRGFEIMGLWDIRHSSLELSGPSSQTKLARLGAALFAQLNHITGKEVGLEII